MTTSVLRGSLRSGGGRAPPFLIIGLLVISGILAFNYWNLSAEYDSVVREIGDLQDKLRILSLKREHAEKQNEAVERRLRDAESQLGRLKISNNQKDQELARANEQLESKKQTINKLQEQISNCQVIWSQFNSTKEMVALLQKKVDEVEEEKQNLMFEHQKLLSERQTLRANLEDLQIKFEQISNVGPPDPFQSIPSAVAGKGKTADSQLNTSQNNTTIIQHKGAEQVAHSENVADKTNKKNEIPTQLNDRQKKGAHGIVHETQNDFKRYNGGDSTDSLVLGEKNSKRLLQLLRNNGSVTTSAGIAAAAIVTEGMLHSEVSSKPEQKENLTKPDVREETSKETNLKQEGLTTSTVEENKFDKPKVKKTLVKPEVKPDDESGVESKQTEAKLEPMDDEEKPEINEGKQQQQPEIFDNLGQEETFDNNVIVPTDNDGLMMNLTKAFEDVDTPMLDFNLTAIGGKVESKNSFGKNEKTLGDMQQDFADNRTK